MSLAALYLYLGTFLVSFAMSWAIVPAVRHLQILAWIHDSSKENPDGVILIRISMESTS